MDGAGRGKIVTLVLTVVSQPRELVSFTLIVPVPAPNHVTVAELVFCPAVIVPPLIVHE
jgi:hypothetical protein